MRCLKVRMAFRGTNYHGFQTQPNAVTVQETVEKALSILLQEDVKIDGCSRTDTGVHAADYCFSMHTQNALPEYKIIRGSCAYLPPDIALKSVEEAPDGFHARYCCRAKKYVYRIHASESGDPFMGDFSLHYRRRIDLEKMRRAGVCLVGTHDFSSFCANAQRVPCTVRTVRELDIAQCGETVLISITGNGFLYNMVRIIVGTLLGVSEGRIAVEQMEEILHAQDRTRAGATAPAKGLTLARVYYDEDITDRREERE